jgi:hypothetical protein
VQGLDLSPQQYSCTLAFCKRSWGVLLLLLLLLLLQGTKWTATKWIHNKPYGGGFDPLKLAAQCRDTADDCR